MATRERLQVLVDDLADSEVQVAIRLLQALRKRSDPVALTLLTAPADQEPDDDDADGGLTEAREEKSLSREEIRSHFRE